MVAAINGVLEELLWRGCYTGLFPDHAGWGVAWPSVWFAVWHVAPGSLLAGSEAMRLVAGAALLGCAFGWVAWRTGSIRWTAASHVLAGLIQA
jgi:membrane protease YdiL (CAAX protease family)